MKGRRKKKAIDKERASKRTGVEKDAKPIIVIGILDT